MGSKKKKHERSVVLLLRVGSDDATVLAIEPASASPRRSDLRGLRVLDDNWTDLPAGAGELIVGFHDTRGEVRAVHAWPLRQRVSHDVIPPRDERHGVSGDGGDEPDLDDRVMHLRIPKKSVFMGIYRSRTRRAEEPLRGHPIDRTTILCDGPQGEMAWDLDVLSIYALNPPTEPPPALPPGPLQWPLPSSELRFDIQQLRRLPSPFADSSRPRDGWVDSEETYFDHGDPADRFNVVVLGDGFDDRELTTFDRNVKTIIHGVFGGTDHEGISPFNELRASVNLHIVRAVSHDSGITNCEVGHSCGETRLLRRTYYETAGCYGQGYPGFCGSRAPERIWQSARRFATPDQVGLYLVLVNCVVPGGSAWIDRKTAYVTLGLDRNDMIRTAAHVMAQVIAGVGQQHASAVTRRIEGGHNSVPIDGG